MTPEREEAEVAPRVVQHFPRIGAGDLVHRVTEFAAEPGGLEGGRAHVFVNLSAERRVREDRHAQPPAPWSFNQSDGSDGRALGAGNQGLHRRDEVRAISDVAADRAIHRPAYG